MPCAGVANNRSRHDSDWACACHEHILAKHIEGKRGVNRVSERIEDRLYVTRNVRVMHPHVCYGQREVLSECTRPVYSNPLRVLAQMPAASQTIAASPAHDVPLATNDIPNVKVVHVRTNLDNPAHKLVTDHHGHRDRTSRPCIPLEDMQVRATNAGT